MKKLRSVVASVLQVPDHVCRIWQYDPVGNAWTNEGNAPSVNEEEDNVNMFAANGKGLVITGTLGQFWRMMP